MAKIAKKSENGFTLIEVLLISVIVLLIAVSVTMLFTGGRKTWTSADEGSETIQNAVIGMEKLVREIKNSPGLTYFSDSEIRFKVPIRNDGKKFAKVKRVDNYLKYGEKITDEGWIDGDLSNLAYPVIELLFSFKKLDGSAASLGTDPADVKLVLIKMKTSKDGVTIPLTTSANLAPSKQVNFDGTLESGGEDHFNEGNDETTTPGSKGDGVKGWGLTDYVIFGNESVALSQRCIINGNVGTRGLAEIRNNCDINGYLIVKGSLNTRNHTTINDSVLAACVSPSSSLFENNSHVNGNFWTLNDVTMENGSLITGNIYKPTSAEITDAKCDGDICAIPANPATIDLATGEPHIFMLEVGDKYGTPEKTVLAGESIFPSLPVRQNDGFALEQPTVINGDDVIISSSGGSTTIYPDPAKPYDQIEVGNGILTMGSGTYYINSFKMSNSSKVKFMFTHTHDSLDKKVYNPIRIYIKTSFEVGNTASFGYYDKDVDNKDVDRSAELAFGADLLYIEPRTGMACQNSMRGLIYAPEGDITFSTGGTTLYGAAYSGHKVIMSQQFTAIYVPPAFDYVLKKPTFLPPKFYH
jgi:type II secretory pathway pseudopilin PulG